MITVDLPDGRSVDVNTDDPNVARERARRFMQENPIEADIEVVVPTSEPSSSTTPPQPEDEGLFQEIGE